MPRLELVETSLRAGQQALLVSRLRRRHAVPVARQLDGCGFAALDVFGGTTFEAQLRFLGEQPFERLRAIREAAPVTSLLATIGGQALTGHRHASDDVVDAFVRVAADAGIDIFRCHDPLNDIRNLERCLVAVHSVARKAEGVVIYNPGAEASDQVIEMARTLADRGYDSLCLYDPLGVLGVARTGELVRGIREATSLPLAVSLTAQTGQADFAYMAAVEAGAQRIDVALAPLAGGASFPAAEAVVTALRETVHDTGLDVEKIIAASTLLEGSLIHYGDVADTLAMRLDTAALRGLLPPSGMGHALNELRSRDALERIGEVEAEVARVRAELGYPPLVTPIAEIIATQAVYNVCDGDRYATISQEVKDYSLGLYGNPPAAMDAKVRRLINGREEPITLRPADLLDPGLEAGRAALRREKLAAGDAEAVCYTLFPAEWLALEQGDAVIERLGDEPEPAAAAPAEGAEEGPAATTEAAAAPAAPAEEVRDLRVEVDGQTYDVRVIGAAGSFGGGGGVTTTVGEAAPAKPALREGTVLAPMQGLILKVNVQPGDKVELGQVVAVLEAMKMQNDVTATKAGKVSDVYVKEGSVVSPRDPIIHVD